MISSCTAAHECLLRQRSDPRVGRASGRSLGGLNCGLELSGGVSHERHHGAQSMNTNLASGGTIAAARPWSGFPKSVSGNSFLGSTGHWPTAIELSIGTSSVGRPLPARNERGEGWGEGKSNKNATPLPGPLLLLRRKRGRRARSIRLIQVQWATGLSRPATRRAERGARPNLIRTALGEEAASLFRSAGRRPARAGRPCYPFSGHALSQSG